MGQAVTLLCVVDVTVADETTDSDAAAAAPVDETTGGTAAADVVTAAETEAAGEETTEAKVPGPAVATTQPEEEPTTVEPEVPTTAGRGIN